MDVLSAAADEAPLADRTEEARRRPVEQDWRGVDRLESEVDCNGVPLVRTNPVAYGVQAKPLLVVVADDFLEEGDRNRAAALGCSFEQFVNVRPSA